MTAHHSNALVFFGATGDLAFKKIFPVLKALIKQGDPTLFTRDDSVEAAWRVIDPVLAAASANISEYEPGTWGPEAALHIVDDNDAWHNPQAEKVLPC